MNNTFYVYSPSLSHHGIKGQRWGVRRFQNPDGTLTPAGRRRVQKAMKQHERVMQSGSSKRKQKREYKKFKKMTLSLTDGEVKELIKRLQEDSAINSVTQTKFDEIKSKENSKLIENGLKYAEQTARIISTISAMKNAEALNKYAVAAKAAAIEKDKATARGTNASAEAKEFENYKARTAYQDARDAAANAGYTPPKKTPYAPLQMKVMPKYEPVKMSVESVIFGQPPKQKQKYSPVVMNVAQTALPARSSHYPSSGINYMNYMKTNQNFNNVLNRPLALPPPKTKR